MPWSDEFETWPDSEPEKPLAADWCPTCGESQAEHTAEGMARCVDSFYMTESILSSRCLEMSKTAKPIATRYDRGDVL